MTKLASYHVPGLYVEDHAIDVPLDWRGLEPALLAMGLTMRHGAFPPAIPGAPESIRLFYRVLCAPEHEGDDLPLLAFFQGGPGGACPRPTAPSSDGWIAEAIKRFRVILPDQRGCGRSSRVGGATMERIRAAAEAAGADPARAQANFLKRFLAPSIVRDFEYLRLTAFGGRPWTTLGQSYGGFITLSYLSSYPTGIAAAFTTGGIPHVPASAAEVYAHTFPRMAEKTRRYYERYPEDAARVAAVADRLSAGGVALPDGSPLTVERLQLLGSDFGMKPSFERMHWLFDAAFEAGDGSLDAALARAGAPLVDGAPAGSVDGARAGIELSDGFLIDVLERTTTRANPLYWVLQELIYADGSCAPIRWAAARERDSRPAFAPDARPLLFTGEACFPWMFEQMPELMPFAAAMDVLMEDTKFDRVYDPVRLASNEVPLQAAVYLDDMYVDSTLSLDTLGRVGASHAWVTNEFEHDGVHGDRVFRHLFNEALERGDLARALKTA